MNCNEMEGIVNDLARGQIMEASLREKAMAHSQSCGCCAMRLDDERAITAGLRGLAAATAAEEASPLVESALLNAFREQHSAGRPAPLFGAGRYSARRWAYVAVGAAAAAVIVMMLWLSGSRSQISQPPVPERAGPGTALPPTNEDRHAPNGPSISRGTGGGEIAIGNKHNDRKFTPRRIRNDRQTNRAVKATNEPITAEIATDFIPLMNRESLAQLDSGQVMRVELPRSALMSFGLPMNMERANERIKADVIVGNDGLARAIRFVR